MKEKATGMEFGDGPLPFLYIIVLHLKRKVNLVAALSIPTCASANKELLQDKLKFLLDVK